MTPDLLALSTLLLATSEVSRPPAGATVTVTAELMPSEETRTSRLVKVVTCEELERLGAPTVLEALRRIGGLAYLSYGPNGISHGGMNSSVSIRGMKGGELVLINGVPIQGAAGGAYDMNAIKIGQVERVEVLKGAASTLYGADAMSGVINIILKKPDGRSAQVALEGGNRQHRELRTGFVYDRIQAGFSFTGDGAVDEVSINESKKNRYATDDTRTRTWNLGARLMDGLVLDVLGSRQNTTFDQIAFSGKLQQGTFQQQDKHHVDLRYERKGLSLIAFSTVDLMRRQEYTNPKAASVLNRNQNLGLRGVYDLGLQGGSLQVGAEWMRRKAAYPVQYGDRSREDMALFSQGRLDLGSRSTATVGLRGQYIRGEQGADSHKKLLPSLGLTFQASHTVHLFANASQAFRLPTFNNLYYQSGFMVGNPELKPEQGWTFETGLKQDTARTHTRLGLFRMAYSDKIEVNRTLGPISSYYNAGSYSSRGLEWDLGLSPLAGSELWLTTTGYWADPSALDPKGMRTQTGPKLQASLGLRGAIQRLQWDMGSTTLAMRERGMPATTLVNAHFTMKIGPGTASLSLDNLLDRHVELVGDFTPETTNRYVYYDQGFTVKAAYALSF